MKSTNEPRPLRAVITHLLESYRLENQYRAARIKDAWKQEMGGFVVERTQEITFRDGRLCVTLSSPALRQEILLAKSDVIQRLNRYVGADLIAELIIL
ncbi:MAG: DUF721 domain-containing protein [Bernardetiaceae bacterium]